MSLQSRIDDRSATVGVIGLGYVGLPLLHAFWQAGMPVIGFDVDPEKVATLRRGESYLKHLGEQFVCDMAASDHFDVTCNVDRLGEPDAVLICVPTPLDEQQNPDLSFVQKAADDVAGTLRPQQLIVLESSTYPGTTRDVVQPRLERGGMSCGRDFYLAYSPEREDPGRSDHTTRTIPKLVGGIDDESGRIAVSLYQKTIRHVVPVHSAEIAEAAKLLENIYRAVNIALVNEMKVVLTHMGINIWDVVEAASTKPFGFQPFYPGPGLGGHCIPIDPYYLAWKAGQVGVPTRFIELAGQINRSMPAYVVQRTVEALEAKGKAIHSAAILVLGLAYKPDVDDIRESPSFELIKNLLSLGARVDYNDPHVPATHKMRRYDLRMTSIDLNPAALERYDCVVIATNHTAYDWQMICDHSALIIDTRHAMKDVKESRGNVVEA